MKKTKIVFWGNERLATGLGSIKPSLLPALLANDYDVCALVLPQKLRRAQEFEVEIIAREHNIPILYAANVDNLATTLKTYKAQVGILASYGSIISSDIRNIFHLGIINLHPSLLPQYRGPSPIEQTILDGIFETGVSIMCLEDKMDAGPLYAQKKLALDGCETKSALAEALLNLGTDTLMEVLPKIVRGDINPTPQSAQHISYTNRFAKNDGLLTSNLTAQECINRVRAFANWPGTYIEAMSTRISVFEVQPIYLASAPKEILNSYQNKLIFKCADGAFEITKLKIAGKKLISGLDFINSHTLTKHIE